MEAASGFLRYPIWGIWRKLGVPFGILQSPQEEALSFSLSLSLCLSLFLSLVVIAWEDGKSWTWEKHSGQQICGGGELYQIWRNAFVPHA